MFVVNQFVIDEEGNSLVLYTAHSKNGSNIVEEIGH